MPYKEPYEFKLFKLAWGVFGFLTTPILPLLLWLIMRKKFPNAAHAVAVGGIWGVSMLIMYAFHSVFPNTP